MISLDEYLDLADDDPTAPWNTDQNFGGVTPQSARASWEATERRRAQLRLVDAPPIDDRPLPAGPEDYGIAGRDEETVQPLPMFGLPPLTIDEWLARDLPEPDRLLGHWLTTTSRVILAGATGLGKSNFVLHLGMSAAAGFDFLHWKARRKCKVLYIDGEMSTRLLQQRIADTAARLGCRPDGFFALSREDLDEMPPLNTPAGQACIEAIIREIGGVDLIIFDAIMCLLVGDMKDGESWAQVMPWVRSLTKRRIGQIWLHHTGHDETKSYGDKSKEWQLDTVLHMVGVDHPETDVSFNLEFRKARERTPDTRADFRDCKVTLIGDAWQSDAKATTEKKAASPLGMKFLTALVNVLAGDTDITRVAGRRATTVEAWFLECARMGLIDPKEKPASARTLINKHRRELVSVNQIACDGGTVWTL